MFCSVCSPQNYLYGQYMLNCFAKSKHLFLHLLFSLGIYATPLPAAETSLECLFSTIFKLKGFFLLFFFFFFNENCHVSQNGNFVGKNIWI